LPRQEPTAPPAAPPAAPQPLRTPARQQSLFEPSNRREAALRQWSAQNGGTPATGLQAAPAGAGGSGNAMKPLFFDGTAGGVQQASEARALTGAGAYAVLETRVKNAQAAQARLDAVERKLAEELAILGPLLTPEERESFIQSFRAEHAEAYAARDAAVGALADHLEAEGANIEAYLKDVQGISPYMLGLHAVPVQQALRLVADSPRAATAVAYLNASENQLLQQLGDPAGQYLEQDVYGPAIHATLTSALASGQSSGKAIAEVTTLIQQMPEGVQERILGADPQVMLGHLSSVASGNVGALKNLAAEAGKLGTPGATALVSAALSMAMLQSPELLQDSAALKLLIQPLGNAGMSASAVSMALKGVGSVVSRVGFQPDLGGAPMLLGKLGTILGAATAGLRVLNLLGQADRNMGTYVQAGAQAFGGIVSTASVLGLVSGPVGIGVAATTFLVTELGKAWEKGIHREEAAKACLERATQLGIPDAQMRVNLGFNYGTQVRELSNLGIDYQRMNEIIPRFTDTTRLALLAQGLELSPEEVGRVLDLVVPPGMNSSVEVTGFNLLMGLYQQAREANPGGTPEQLIGWMRNNAPPPLHGGAGYLFMGSMLNLLDSTQ
ncbi:hypothetical protein D7Y21_40665, partial [Corallococcus sp. AB045]